MRFGTTLKEGPSFTDFEIELAYLTGDAGTVRGGCAKGKLMDWNYKATANEIGHIINRLSRDDLSHTQLSEREPESHGNPLQNTYALWLGMVGQSKLTLMKVCHCTASCARRSLHILSTDLQCSTCGCLSIKSKYRRCLKQHNALCIICGGCSTSATSRQCHGKRLVSYFADLSGNGGIAVHCYNNARGVQRRSQKVSKADKELKGIRRSESERKPAQQPTIPQQKSRIEMNHELSACKASVATDDDIRYCLTSITYSLAKFLVIAELRRFLWLGLATSCLLVVVVAESVGLEE